MRVVSDGRSPDFPLLLRPQLPERLAVTALPRSGWKRLSRGDYQSGGTIEDFGRATVVAAGRLQIDGAGVNALSDAWRSIGYLGDSVGQTAREDGS